MSLLEPRASSSDATSQQALLRQHLERLAWLYDGIVRLPGGVSLGLDAVLGLIPVVGDVVGFLLGAHLIYRSRQLGVPAALQRRMVANLAVDVLAGLLPGVGDVADLLFRANARNIALLQVHLDPAASPPLPARRMRWAGVLLTLAVVLGALGLWWLRP